MDGVTVKSVPAEAMRLEIELARAAMAPVSDVTNDDDE